MKKKNFFIFIQMIFKQLYYTFRNYTNANYKFPLGRWNRENNIDINAYLQNRDSCGYNASIHDISIYINKIIKNKKINSTN